ncbi:MAG: cation-translocating P-type ATPase, partial [Oscillospiraceae bacterium]
KILPNISVYARVSPEHKIRIVNLWQQLGHIVAMTGDGVNDAPALKKADVGVAMGITGTQVSKDAASMILTDDNFATIVKSVANGRRIYQNIQNAIKFLISGNIAAIIAVLYTVIFGLPMPFTAVHLLFINLLTDSLPAIAISMEKSDGNVMKQKPRRSNENILDKQLRKSIFIQGILIAIVTIVAYYIGLSVSSATASTMAFATLCLARLFACFNCRSNKPITKIGLKSNPFSLVAFLLGVVFLAVAIFVTPLHSFLDVSVLSIGMILSIGVLAFVPTLIIQVYKMVTYKE